MNQRAGFPLSGAHRAGMDAADALALFRRQLDRLPDPFAASLLSNPPTSSTSLIARIAQELSADFLEPAPTPTWVVDTAADRDALAAALSSARGSDRRVPLKPVPPPDEQPHPLREHIEVRTQEVQRAILGKKEFDRGLPERLPHIAAAVRAAQENGARTGQRSGVLVFVTRRSHSEAVASAIAQETGTMAEAFHAGLSAGLREELVEDFRDGRIDVLVATKAFGMGMDIPDVHYVVHLSPPAYLEDYLQEVGRIGRGKREREAAGFDRLPATLLWSPADFVVARDLRKKNEVTEASIRSFHSELWKHATGDRVIVPAHGFETYTSDGHKRALETRCRMSLHWLEEAGRLTLVNLVRTSLSVYLHADALRRIVKEESSAGCAAGQLLAIIGDDNSPGDRTAGGEGQLVLLDVGALSRACGHAGTDETVAALAELRERRALEIDWTLSASPLRLWKQPPEQTNALIHAVEQGITRGCAGRVRSRVHGLPRRRGGRGIAEYDFGWMWVELGLQEHRR